MNDAHFVRQLYWFSFLARAGIGIIGWFLTLYVELPFLQDALHYEQLGQQVAEDWLDGRSSPWLASAMTRSNSPWFMVVVLAVFYTLVGGVRITPVAIAAYSLITACAPVLIYRIGLQLGAPSAGARKAAWLVAFSPAFAFWSGAIYKEGLVLVCMNLAIYHTLLLQAQWRLRSIVVLALCFPALFGLRFYLAMILGVVVGLGLFLGRARGGVEAIAGALARQLVTVTVVFAALVAIGFADRVGSAMPADLQEGLDRIQSSRNDLANNKSGYLRVEKVSSPERALEFLPLGLGYFLTVPWPWQIGSMRQNLVIPETAFWVIFLYPCALVGLKDAVRRNFQGTILLVIAMASICCLYALMLSNVGVTYRLRIQVWDLLAVFAGWGWESWRRPVARRWPEPRFARATLERRAPVSQAPVGHASPWLG